MYAVPVQLITLPLMAFYSLSLWLTVKAAYVSSATVSDTSETHVLHSHETYVVDSISGVKPEWVLALYILL